MYCLAKERYYVTRNSIGSNKVECQNVIASKQESKQTSKHASQLASK